MYQLLLIRLRIDHVIAAMAAFKKNDITGCGIAFTALAAFVRPYFRSIIFCLPGCCFKINFTDQLIVVFNIKYSGTMQHAWDSATSLQAGSPKSSDAIGPLRHMKPTKRVTIGNVT